MTAKIVTITSGKGGVGKTTTTANVAIALAELGEKVVCIDGDIGLRNLDVVMGLENRIVYDLVDVIEGRCRLRQAMRTFRVDRIQRVTSLKIPFTIPRDFSARDYITQTLSFEQNYTVVVHLAASVAPHIRERYGHWMELAEYEDGSVTARFGASTLEWATGWVLSYGESVRVLEPPELGEHVRAAAKAILQYYA